ncbi:MAG: hypothetical protein Q4D12_11185 [Bacteroidales bacterium]|nr:hypothetical protein [Bacteroidales bacterium]
MKKVVFFAAVVVAAVAGTTCYNHESNNELSGEMLVIYPDGDYGFDIEFGVKKPGWL